MSNQPPTILMVTRPINPPWNEASKNFTFELASRIEKFNFHLMTSRNAPLPNIRNGNVTLNFVYTSPELIFTKKQKLLLLKFLLNFPKGISVAHFLFTPSKITTRLIKSFVIPRAISKNPNLKTIQTVATLNYPKINRRNLKKYFFADKIITYSKYTESFLKKAGLQNVTCIYPGIDVKKFSPAPPDKKLLKRYEIKANEKIVIYPGEYTRLKAADLIFQAAVKIIKEYPFCKFLFACRLKSKKDALKKRELEKKATALKIRKNFIFIENFEKMEKLYNLSQIMLFPVSEMSGKFDIALSVLEAMACGLPTIISDIKPLNEVIRNPNSALTVKPGSQTEIEKILKKLLQNSALMDKLRIAGRKNIVRNFNIENTARKYETLYSEL